MKSETTERADGSLPATALCCSLKDRREWIETLSKAYLSDTSYLILDHDALGNLLWHLGVKL